MKRHSEVDYDSPPSAVEFSEEKERHLINTAAFAFD